MNKNLTRLVKEKILVLDGAMGTMIQKYGFEEKDYRGLRFANSNVELKGNYDLLVITQPQSIIDIHRAYLAAGADIIETNSLNANAVSLAEYKMESLAYEMNCHAALLARKAADEFSTSEKPRFVAGSIGPTNKSLSMSPDVVNPAYRNLTFDELYDAYFNQVRGLVDGNVDALLVETVFDTLNAKAALVAINDYCRQNSVDIPVMVSVTLSDTSGRTLSGQTLDAFYNTFSSMNLFCIGLNCGFGSKQMMPHIQELARISNFNICVYPNAGLPDKFGKYTLSPEDMANDIELILKNGWVNIIGGCCGTTPEHIKKIAEKVDGHQPRKPLKQNHVTAFSGLEVVKAANESNFINIGERTNVAGSKKFARLIREQKFEEAMSVARQQIEDGAQIIDVCMDDAMIDSQKAMCDFLNMLASDPNISKVPVMIDSSKWNVIQTGLKCLQGKSIVNSINLKDGEIDFIEKAEYVKKFGAAAVVMLFDEQGQADTFDRKIQIASRAYRLLTEKINFPPHDIIIDPNILAISTGIEEHNAYAVDFIRCCKWIRQNLPYAKVSGGISNLSFAYRGNDTIREAIHSVFLYHAIAAGMDMGIVNPEMKTIYSEINPQLLGLVEDVVLNKHSDATERLLEYSEKNIKKDAVKNIKSNHSDSDSLPADEQLQFALVKGIPDKIEEIIDSLLLQYKSPVQIIEQPLMQAMNKVGDLFGEGKMFLPQVIKSARVMKKAVAYLQPLIEQEKLKNADNRNTKKVLLATVKGDVHDIGKNIVSIVLSCSGCEIIDLGVMVPAKRIIDTAIREDVDVIGLCGLITPSLDEMIRVVDEAKLNNLKIPILIGGAATSKLHTAVAMAVKYSEGVIYVKDASRSVDIIKNILSPELKINYLKNLNIEYGNLKQKYEAEQQSHSRISIEEARKNRLQLNWDSEQIFIPEFTGVHVFNNISLNDIIPLINQKELYHAFGLKNNKIEHDKLQADADKLLKMIADTAIIKAKAVAGIFAANSVDEDIIIFDSAKRNSEICRLHAARSTSQKAKGENNLSLADFIAPLDSGLCDYIGCFVATAGIGANEFAEKLVQTGDEYSAILLKILTDRLAEALSEWLHNKVRNDLWGFQHKGIRPAVGFPVYPDHNEKKKIFTLLDAEKNTEVTLTDTCAMSPASSVCGLYLANAHARYFDANC
ncbi:MAG: methionine synthase [Prevotellaceae bacterium]|jgi:5-methyltetrahydrofolate--homocysteine methyltransferase|nr:methionine synthase [Prevotellaceae bacterium]